MKQVGIITLFHGSLNYGGVLQAFALCKALDSLNIPNEQIRCIYAEEAEARDLGEKIKKAFNPKVVWRRICYELNEYRSEKNKVGRREAFAKFNQQYIPSSSRVYTTETIQECLPDYDAFITGSDQVWNPEWYCPTLFLDFVPSDRCKISYAASLGKRTLTEKQQTRFLRHLKDFSAVSVREPDVVDAVASLSPVPVECVLDPTLLLSETQWNSICSDRQVADEYVFCYFLGEDSTVAQLVQEYARKNNLLIVGIPYVLADYCKKSVIRYDVVFPDASPADFLSLIRYARCVFTDSFHATVFSGVFHKDYFVYPRLGHSGMSGRIYRVASLFGSQERFCDTPEKISLEYAEQQKNINYECVSPELTQLRLRSFDFLKMHLSGVSSLEQSE